MLVIQSHRQLMDSMELAQETKTEDQLIKWLLYLNEWHSKDTTIIELHADLPMRPDMIMWYAYHTENGEKVGENFYNGGLVFHSQENDWSIHS